MELNLPKNNRLSMQCFFEGDQEANKDPSYVILENPLVVENKRWILYSIENGKLGKKIKESSSPVNLYKVVWGDKR